MDGLKREGEKCLKKSLNIASYALKMGVTRVFVVYLR